MAISIDWATKVISIPQADLTLVSGALYELDVDWLRLELKTIEDSETGSVFPDTHRHNTQVTLSGVTYARTFEIINGYTITFENGMYSVRCVGANHNIADVKNVNSVSLIVGNSAGLIAVGGADPWAVEIENSLTAQEVMRILLAVAAGKTTVVDLGAGAATVAFRDQADTKDRVAVDMQDSDRETVVVDGA